MCSGHEAADNSAATCSALCFDPRTIQGCDARIVLGMPDSIRLFFRSRAATQVARFRRSAILSWNSETLPAPRLPRGHRAGEMPLGLVCRNFLWTGRSACMQSIRSCRTVFVPLLPRLSWRLLVDPFVEAMPDRPSAKIRPQGTVAEANSHFCAFGNNFYRQRICS
jgi:hypothetical protein